MPIQPDKLRFYLSGGPSNQNPHASLGGPRSEQPVSGGLNGIFDLVTGDEAAMGETEYRCVYFRNEDMDVDGLIDPVVWVAQQVEEPTQKIEIALGGGKNQLAAKVASPFEAPEGVIFTSPPIKSRGLRLPGAPYLMNDFVAIWLRRTVQAGSPSGEATAVVRLEGDTF